MVVLLFIQNHSDTYTFLLFIQKQLKIREMNLAALSQKDKKGETNWVQIRYRKRQVDREGKRKGVEIHLRIIK